MSSKSPVQAAAIRRAVDAYVSRSIPRDVQTRIKPFVRAAVIATKPPTVASAKNLARDISLLAAWCLDVGLPLDTEVVFDPDTIERYITAHGSVLSATALRTYRPNLRRVARAVAPTLQPPSPAPHQRAYSKLPYSRTEIDGLIRLAENQASRMRSRRLLVLLCLGLGAGLQPGEYQDVRDEDVFCRDRVVYVAIGRSAAHVVPVLEPYGQRLLKLSVVIADDYLLGGEESGDRRNSVRNVLQNLVGASGLPRIESGRLRATWLTHHIERLGVDAFLAAAGVQRSNAFFDLVALLPIPANERVTRFLKGKV